MFVIPSGIQQKYIVVTCNYVARQQGVTKLMSVTDAKQKCPQLVLVKGEDLTHYREMSYQVTGRPHSHSTWMISGAHCAVQNFTRLFLSLYLR